MNYSNEDLEAFMIEAELISEKVKALAENKISPEEFDRLEALRAEDKRRREEALHRKELEKYELKRQGREGKGITKDFLNFCRFCRKEYELATPTCLKCKRPTMSLEERQAQLSEMVEEYKEKKAKRAEKKYKWNMWQKTQASTWRKTSNNYCKWDYFVSESEEETESEPIVPKNDPNFKALEMDMEERKRKRIKDTEQAKKLKEKGNEALKNGDFQTAVDKYTLALEHIKDIKSIYTNRALAYIKLKKYRKAVKDCDNVIEYMEIFTKEEHKDISFKAFSRKALALKELSEFEEAKTAIEAALKIYQDDKPAQLLKLEIEGLLAHKKKVNQIIIENSKQSTAEESNKANETTQAEVNEPDSDEEKNAAQLDRKVVKELLEDSVKEMVQEPLNQKEVQEPVKPIEVIKINKKSKIDQLKEYVNDLKEENAEKIFELLISEKELIAIFIASKGIQKCLKIMLDRRESSRLAMLVGLCLIEDGVGEKCILDFGISNIHKSIINMLSETKSLNSSIYGLISDLLEILTSFSLFEPYRLEVGRDALICSELEELFTLLITKIRSNPEVLSSFLIYLSNLCTGNTMFKINYLASEKFGILLEAIRRHILDKETKNRHALNCKQHAYSLLANLLTHLPHRKEFTSRLGSEGFDEIALELSSYPRSAHNYSAYVEAILSMLVNGSLDMKWEYNSLSWVVFDRFIKNYEEQKKETLSRSLLFLSRALPTNINTRQAEWIRVLCDILLADENPLKESKSNSDHVLRILNLFYSSNLNHRAKLSHSAIEKLHSFIKNNDSNETLYCNTANLFGIIVKSDFEWKKEIVDLVKELMEHLIYVAKEKTGNWRKNSATLIAKAAESNADCRTEMNKYHGMDVLRSVAAFVK